MTPDERERQAIRTVRGVHASAGSDAWRELIAARIETIKEQIIDAEPDDRHALAATAKALRALLADATPSRRKDQ